MAAYKNSIEKNVEVHGQIESRTVDNVMVKQNNKLDKRSSDSGLGLSEPKALVCLGLWYLFSCSTLFLNKYILSYKNGDATILGMVQLLSCIFGGYIHLHIPCEIYKKQIQDRKPPFYNLVTVGMLRFSTILLGLVALWYVPVSFAETVKSTAPVFTVIISYLVLKEEINAMVALTLLPIMFGLAYCSIHELHFNMAGFVAAMATNLSECFQNVFSKMLLSNEKFRLSPPELQFYTSLASIIVQVPTFFALVNFQALKESLDSNMIMLLFIGGLSFQYQSLTEYTLLGLISPVTHSVANTVKRALLIWLAILTFGNPVTVSGAIGTTIVIIGVFFYNKAREWTSVNEFRERTPSAGKTYLHSV